MKAMQLRLGSFLSRAAGLAMIVCRRPPDGKFPRGNWVVHTWPQHCRKMSQDTQYTLVSHVRYSVMVFALWRYCVLVCVCVL